MKKAAILFAILAFMASCGDDGGTVDASPGIDASTADANTVDANTVDANTVDASTVDAAAPNFSQ